MSSILGGAFWCIWYSRPGATIILHIFLNNDFSEKKHKKSLKDYILWTNQSLGKLKPENLLFTGLKLKLNMSRRDDFGSTSKKHKFWIKKHTQRSEGH